jgi:DNA-binding GntR family transcriptional regulator
MARDFSDGGRVVVPSGVVGTLASTVYDRLRDDIMSGELAPAEKLRVEYLRARYGAGTSPIREALNRLSSDGFVVQEDQKGFRVAPVSRDELIELIKTRCWLEGLAIRQSIANGDQAWEESIVLAFHRLSRVPKTEGDTLNPQWEDLHTAFHRSLLTACGSNLLEEFCDQLADRARRYRRLAVIVSYPERNEHEEHRDLMEAMLARDADTAVALLDAHYQRTGREIEEYASVFAQAGE